MLLGSALMAGMVSCNKETTSPDVQPLKVVEHARVSTVVTNRGMDTKAAFSGTNTSGNVSGTLSWNVGDKIVIASNGQVNGTLICTEVPDGQAKFEGDITQFTPASVYFYYLGNKDATGVNGTYDFSQQSGTLEALTGLIFLKSEEVKLSEVEGESGEYYYDESVNGGAFAFNSTPLVSLLTLDLAIPNTPGAQTGTNVKSVQFSGLANKLRLNLITGEMEPINTENATRISPGSNYTTSYVMAVIPQTADEVKMTLEYTDGESMVFSGINWTIEEGKNYKTDFSNAELVVDPVSNKFGYNGLSIVGDDGISNKKGYNGFNADGSIDDPKGNKKGYNGFDLTEKKNN